MTAMLIAGALIAAYIINLVIVIHNAPTMKDIEDLEEYEEGKDGRTV